VFLGRIRGDLLTLTLSAKGRSQVTRVRASLGLGIAFFSWKGRGNGDSVIKLSEEREDRGYDMTSLWGGRLAGGWYSIRRGGRE